MEEFIRIGVDQFPDTEVVGFVWPAASAETPIHINVDGHRFSIKPNIKYMAAMPVYEVVDNSGYLVNRIDLPAIDDLSNPPSAPSTEQTGQVSPPAEQADAGDGAGVSAGGGETISAETFDPDAIIAGTVTEVATLLAALTSEQLDAVAAAEADRESPRKGVMEAIAAVRGAAS